MSMKDAVSLHIYGCMHTQSFGFTSRNSVSCALAWVNDADAANISISVQRMFFFLSICCHLVGLMLAKL